MAKNRKAEQGPKDRALHTSDVTVESSSGLVRFPDATGWNIANDLLVVVAQRGTHEGSPVFETLAVFREWISARWSAVRTTQ